MIDQQIDTIETRLMRLERANRRLAWWLGTVAVIAAVFGSLLGAQMLERTTSAMASEANSVVSTLVRGEVRAGSQDATRAGSRDETPTGD